MGSWRQLPLTLDTDLAHGGRWTSLRSGEREWLWSNTAGFVAARHRVVPGGPFVDAGGGEECWPTVRGRPDHGEAWARPWAGTPERARVAVDGWGELARRVSADQALQLDYRLTGSPGTTFLHAVHLLLDLSSKARLEVPGATRMRLLDDDRDLGCWPSGLDLLGPDDGTAVCVLIPDCGRATVVDGEHALRFHWSTASPAPTSLLLWRNLGGWPSEAPYRSIGIEPMIGRAADRSQPAEDCAEFDGSGQLSWRLIISAWRR